MSIIVVMLMMLTTGCGQQKKQPQQHDLTGIPEVNLAHLFYLYDDIELPGGRTGGIVHIYSEFPDYNYAIEINEGFTCVDDVARAMMIDAIRFSDKNEIMAKYDKMAEFLLHMQAENGYFHNFIWNNLSINKEYRTSLAEPNWWSWRAFWALSNYNGNNDSLKVRVIASCSKLADNIFNTYLEKQKYYDTIDGVVVPTWLPLETAGDQAALLIIGMEAYYQNINKDTRVLKLIEVMADGLIKTQKGGVGQFPFGAFLSWQNMWHAYGNNQAYAMLRAGRLLDREDYIESALLEINNLYPYLKDEKYLSTFSVQNREGMFDVAGINHFPQIAYGFRPVIWACVEAFNLTRENKYLDWAIQTATWFSGENLAQIPMYDESTGRCFDGIIAPGEYNRNSGAESTIEALLSLQVLEPYEDD
jgi:hypothetical protein